MAYRLDAGHRSSSHNWGGGHRLGGTIKRTQNQLTVHEICPHCHHRLMTPEAAVQLKRITACDDKTLQARTSSITSTNNPSTSIQPGRENQAPQEVSREFSGPGQAIGNTPRLVMVAINSAISTENWDDLAQFYQEGYFKDVLISEICDQLEEPGVLNKSNIPECYIDLYKGILNEVLRRYVETQDISLLLKFTNKFPKSDGYKDILRSHARAVESLCTRRKDYGAKNILRWLNSVADLSETEPVGATDCLSALDRTSRARASGHNQILSTPEQMMFVRSEAMAHELYDSIRAAGHNTTPCPDTGLPPSTSEKPEDDSQMVFQTWCVRNGFSTIPQNPSIMLETFRAQEVQSLKVLRGIMGCLCPYYERKKGPRSQTAERIYITQEGFRDGMEKIHAQLQDNPSGGFLVFPWQERQTSVSELFTVSRGKVKVDNNCTIVIRMNWTSSIVHEPTSFVVALKSWLNKEGCLGTSNYPKLEFGGTAEELETLEVDNFYTQIQAALLG